MNVSDVRFLFAYDRWATEKILAVAGMVPFEEWEESNRIDRRGLGGILTHALGAHERWRAGWQGIDSPGRRETGPLPSVAELTDAWVAEWAALDTYLGTLADDDLGAPVDDTTLGRTMVHVVNHGTQHRSEAAVLLTIMGRSPGDLDLIDFAPGHGG
jgi:uncharacterized damage-inducible protein DinB